MSYEVRVPGELLTASLPDWVKMVWIAIRSRQGKKNAATVSLRGIAERCMRASGKPMDRGQVANAIKKLKATGWLETTPDSAYRCLVPAAPSVEQDSTPKPEVLNRVQQSVEQDSKSVEQDSTPSENQKETKGKTKEREARARGFTPPVLVDVQLYFQHLEIPDEAEPFYDHYTCNGWTQGRQSKPMKDWKAAGRNWKRRMKDFNRKGKRNGRTSNQMGVEELEPYARAAARLEAASQGAGDARLCDGTTSERGALNGRVEVASQALLGF